MEESGRLREAPGQQYPRDAFKAMQYIYVRCGRKRVMIEAAHGKKTTSASLIALMRGLSMSPPRCPCPVFCMYLSVEACLSPSLPFAVFALRLVGCDNVCCSSLVLSITAGSGRFPAVNSQSIYVPFGLVNSKKKTTL